MKNDRAIMFGKEVDHCFSTSGHYCIDIQPNKKLIKSFLDEVPTETILIFEENLNLTEKKNKL